MNIVLLNPQTSAADTEYLHTRLDFVRDDDLNFLSKLSASSGDFWWIDLSSPEALTQLPQSEFLELLYLKQLGSAINFPHFPTLQNRFAYFGHDDGWALRLWVDSPKLIARILAPALTLKYATFSGRRSFPKPNMAIASVLVARAADGLVIDYRQVDAHADSVPIYRVGAVKNTDDAQRLVDEQKRSRAKQERLQVSNGKWIHVPPPK